MRKIKRKIEDFFEEYFEEYFIILVSIFLTAGIVTFIKYLSI